MKYVATPRLLDGLADLTAIRDIELLEFSLLKTLHGFMQPQAVSLIKLSPSGEPRKEIVYGDNRCHVTDDNILVPEVVREALRGLSADLTAEQVVERDGQVLTVFLLIETRTVRSFLLITTSEPLTKLDLHLVRGMLQICRNFFGLLRHAQTDQLTGLASRRTFDESISRIFETRLPTEGFEQAERRSERPGSYWLAMLDIDHFKSVNDRFGHLYGDEVLVLLAQILKRQFRENDLVFRFGGEEFALITHCPDQESCQAVLERLRQAVESHKFPKVGQVTISIGATEMAPSTFVMTLVDYADQALYYSKRNGRNRITFFEDLVSAGIAEYEQLTRADVTLF